MQIHARGGGGPGATQRFPEISRSSGGRVFRGWGDESRQGLPVAAPPSRISFRFGHKRWPEPLGQGGRWPNLLRKPPQDARGEIFVFLPTYRAEHPVTQAGSSARGFWAPGTQAESSGADGRLLDCASPGSRAGTGRRKEMGRSTLLPLPGRPRHALLPTLRGASGRTGFEVLRRMPFLLSVFLACSLWHNVSSQHIQPSCLTDYESEVVCQWEVNALTDCSKEFRMHVTTQTLNVLGPSWVCPPERKRGPDPIPKCICAIRSEVLHNYVYKFSLEASGKEIWKMNVDPDDIVKPRRLVNLTITRKNDAYILTWADDYKVDNPLHQNPEADYEVAYWPRNQADEVRKHMARDLQYKILGENLTPGAIYSANVRHKINSWKGIWSDWSAVCIWRNEIEPQSDYILWIFTPLLCVFIMALATISFFCFIRMKKGWWDQIPNPTKSKVVAGVTAAPFRNVGLEQHVHIDSCIASAKAETHKERDCQVPHEDTVTKLFRDLMSGDLSSGDTSVLDKDPLLKDQAPGHMQSAFSFSEDAPLEKHSDVLEASSKPLYHNISIQTAASSQPGRAAQELPHSLLFPEAQPITTDKVEGVSTVAPQPSGYKCFSSLVAEPMATLSQVCEEGQEFSPFSDQIQPFSHDTVPCLAPGTSSLHPAFQGDFPEDQDSLWFPSCMEAAEQEARPGSPSQHAPGMSGPCPAASLLSGYRSFSSALQGDTVPQGISSSAGSGLDGQPPYKSLLSIVQDSPTAATGVNRVLFHAGWGAQEVRGLAWPSAPCGANLGVQQAVSDGCFREDVSRDKSLSYP